MADTDAPSILSYPLNLLSGSEDTQYVQISIRVPSQSTAFSDTTSASAYIPPNPSPPTGVAYSDTTQGTPPTYPSTGPATPWVQKLGMSEQKEHILLPMPNTFAVNSVITYDVDDPGELSKFIDSARNIGIGLAKDKLREYANKKISNSVNGIKKFVTGDDGKTTEKDITRLEKMFANPRTEVMFSGIGFREFSFRYMLSPKNEEESTMINNIIKVLRYYSTPELTSGKLFFILPGEFYIKFMMFNKTTSKYDINPNIPKIATTVLTNVVVNYNSTGNIWSTLPNGAPVMAELALTFKEIERIDRTRISNKDVTLSGY